MRFLLTMGNVTLIDVRLFEVNSEAAAPESITLIHHYDGEEGEGDDGINRQLRGEE